MSTPVEISPDPASHDPAKPPSLCFGGSFDPLHVGHLITARLAAEAAGYAHVRLIVAGQSPFKGSSAASPADRLAMCHTAVGDDAFFEVDDREVARDGPSYTADTASQLRDALSQPPAWLIGADLLRGLPRWHRAAELLAADGPLVRFVVMRRPGHAIDWPGLPAAVHHLADAVVEVPQIDVSSTLIRARVARNLPIRHMVPDAVADHIAKHQLYRR